MWWIVLAALLILKTTTQILFASTMTAWLPNQYPNFQLTALALMPRAPVFTPPPLEVAAEPTTLIDWSNQGLSTEALILRINDLIAREPGARTSVVNVNVSGNLISERALAILANNFRNIEWLSVANNPNLQHSDTGFHPLAQLEHLNYVDIRGTAFRLNDWSNLGLTVWVQVDHRQEVVERLRQHAAHPFFEGNNGARLERMANHIVIRGELSQVMAIDLARVYFASAVRFLVQRAWVINDTSRAQFEELVDFARVLVRYAQQYRTDDHRASTLGLGLADIVDAHPRLLTELGISDDYRALARNYLELAVEEAEEGENLDFVYSRLGSLLWALGEEEQAVQHWLDGSSVSESSIGLARAYASGRGVARDDDEAVRYILHMFAPGHNVRQALTKRQRVQLHQVLGGEADSQFYRSSLQLALSLADEGRGGLRPEQDFIQVLRTYLH